MNKNHTPLLDIFLQVTMIGFRLSPQWYFVGFKVNNSREDSKIITKLLALLLLLNFGGSAVELVNEAAGFVSV